MTTKTATATGLSQISASQRNFAKAYLLSVSRKFDAPTGTCVFPGCSLPAEDGAHVLPARDGNAYIGNTVPTCKGHNETAEFAPALVARIEEFRTIGAAIIRTDRATVDALAAEWAEAKARVTPVWPE